MRSLLVSLVLGSVIVASSAIAADLTDKGAIVSLDAKKCTITLSDKKVFRFAPKCDFSHLKLNQPVVITYAVKGKVNMASKVAAG